MCMLIFISTNLMFSNHPLILGIMIIMVTLISSLIMGLMLNSFWFSYIIVIIMLSGMLVLFMYMASVASNEKMNISTIMIMMSMIMAMLFFIINFYTQMNEMELNKNYLMMLNSLFSSKSMFITLIMIKYLLLSMITVSKIVNIHEGPLRIKS
uniref:NADH dehydrogenase subunit 6 n=1 Tax=Cymus sp. TaxID=2931286 RepID=A0A8T9ZXC3_9HEMI|nr:NADH dehydrogenase subunit 6 [Cymus sp.]